MNQRDIKRATALLDQRKTLLEKLRKVTEAVQAYVRIGDPSFISADWYPRGDDMAAVKAWVAERIQRDLEKVETSLLELGVELVDEPAEDDEAA